LGEVVSTDLIDLVQRLGQPRVLVIGDLMLDRYIWADAERISQEAPVILLHADRLEERLGGSSSVATMLGALGAKVVLAGIVGADVAGVRIRQILTELGIDHDNVLNDSSRPTTVKERYIGRAQHRHPQQIIRVDYEARSPLIADLEQQLSRLIIGQLPAVDIVLVSDYDKGVCTAGLLRALTKAARKEKVRVLADPIRSHDYSKYAHCTAVTPNRLEAGMATGLAIQTSEQASQAAAKLQSDLGLEAAIVTLDKDGMALARANGHRQIFSTRPRQVYDITGAGDMVLSVLGMALAAGAEYEAAIRLANVAGGLEVEKIGVATVTRDEILRDLIHTGSSAAHKVMQSDELTREIASRRQVGQRLAFTNGCFDVLHAGHVQYLEEAKAQADLLVVGLNSDASVRSLKGPGRPFNSAVHRAQVLAALQAVDYVAIFDDLNPLRLIETIRPDVLVKGADYRRDQVVGAEFVESYGGRVHLAAFVKGFSTTGILGRLGAA
jgi:D-beta-D-heptose 7-phosphate kinase/D-beta-D-heptose 1-phosphate adenosyltransferase